VFDVVFSEKSVHADEFDDDTNFGKLVNDAKVPVVFASMVGPDGAPGRFAPKVEKPMFGAINITSGDVFRSYPPLVNGRPSLAQQALIAAGQLPADAVTTPFLLHYYGPHKTDDGRYTFRYVSAAAAIAAAIGEEGSGVDPALFKDKVVLVGAITAGTYDVKSSPLSALCPGVEVHATAIENLKSEQRVIAAGTPAMAAVAFGGALVAAIVVLIPRRITLKLLGGLLAAAAVVGVGVLLFSGARIYWLPLAVPLLAILLSTVGAFAWSYFTEDRQRRMILKALAQYVSPAVADRIARDPTQVNLGGERRDMTVMFTDLKNFTNMTESMQVEDLTRMINYYFREMSDVILKVDGTVDKYIGDAIMSFWNAPVEQADHALLACRAALGMQQREREIRPELEKLGAKDLLTRIGLNSGTMAVGNMGSERKLNYTVLGDSVNFASRLEGANKFYGTQILMAESTANLVRDHVVVRQVDVLRVKGKKQPMAVFELMGEGAAADGMKSLAERYGRAFSLYRGQQWEPAEAELTALLAEHPNDGPATTLMARIATFRKEPPPAEWDGVYEAKDK
jgi:adenylate cyclase